MTNAATEPQDRLLPHHLTMLRDGSGLPIDLITERGYWSAKSAKELRDLGFTPAQALAPALVIPICNVFGERAGYAARPDQPRQHRNGKLAKYEFPRGSGAVLDVPPRCRKSLGDPEVTLYITEGSKKGDALAAAGACAIALLGVWNWRETNAVGGKTALADWEQVALNGRLVRVVFDSDVATKINVALALRRLKAFLERRGARVEVVYLRHRADGGKQGIDDFLADGGALADLATLVSDAVVMPETGDAALDLPEIIVNGRYLAEIADDAWKVIDLHNRRRPQSSVSAAPLPPLAPATTAGPSFVSGATPTLTSSWNTSPASCEKSSTSRAAVTYQTACPRTLCATCSSRGRSRCLCFAG